MKRLALFIGAGALFGAGYYDLRHEMIAATVIDAGIASLLLLVGVCGSDLS